MTGTEKAIEVPVIEFIQSYILLFFILYVLYKKGNLTNIF